MPTIRPAAVAGAFYPAEPAALAAAVDGYLRATGATAKAGRPPKALIAPHAGYVYSGPVAASAYRLVAPLRGRVRRVVLAGPVHRVPVRGACVPRASAFATPLGEVRLDREMLARLEALPFVVADDRPHALEHSLEVHLPFLQRALGDVALVPVLVGGATPEEAALLLETAWGGEETLVVVSSDLSHFLPQSLARERDGHTAEAIVALRGGLEGDEACGCAPVNGLLALARRRGLRAELVDLRNSGDTAGGRQQVVGYGAFAFRETESGHG